MNDITPVGTAATPAAELPFARLRHELDRMFEELGRPMPSLFRFGEARGPIPAVELVEREHDYRLTAELPGLKEEDVEVSVADGVLAIKGEKHEDSDHKADGFMLSERRYGSFERQIRLPTDADCEAIEAKFKKGVLTLTIGKDVKASKGRKIAIGSD